MKKGVTAWVRERYKNTIWFKPSHANSALSFLQTSAYQHLCFPSTFRKFKAPIFLHYDKVYIMHINSTTHKSYIMTISARSNIIFSIVLYNDKWYVMHINNTPMVLHYNNSPIVLYHDNTSMALNYDKWYIMHIKNTLMVRHHDNWYIMYIKNTQWSYWW